jgi:hypothetical protein
MGGAIAEVEATFVVDEGRNGHTEEEIDSSGRET